MSHFPHLNEYFEKVKEQTVNQGYVLINTLTGGKSFFPQTDQYQSIKERLESYVGHQNPSGKTFKGLSNEFWKFYTHHKSNQSDAYTDLKAMIAKYFRLQGSMERSGLNYPVQGTSAKMSKLAGIYFYRWILENNLWGTVKICVPLHDEWVIEAPEDIIEEADQKLAECMIKAGEFFCKKVEIKVDGGVTSAWEH